MPSEPTSSTTSPYSIEHCFICDIVEVGSKVLDLGCGEGDLLKLLQEKRNVTGAGVEVSEEKVYSCIHKGLMSVHHGDIDEGLADYPDHSFDYVILSETLQEVRKPALVIDEMLRVGRKGIVSFPNFGYWPARLQLFFLGRAPVTQSLPYEWYEGPNIQFFSIKDFIHFCRKKPHTIVRSIYFLNGREIRILPNLRADSALFVLS